MQIYNIENAYYNLQPTFLKKLIVFDIDFCEKTKGLPRIILITRIYFFLPQITRLKGLKNLR
ncbi:hypothetical protein SAMN06265349_103469 [Flavobacterium resistens]|uniref:Uncharacterized protein n=1 Tax=Flavobacterium resistens TaxID=443612 RepID=A0A521DPF2_9FLAO|nr:hypothetical protein SAMN06265349_103469 [Flavobacterium resistens]